MKFRRNSLTEQFIEECEKYLDPSFAYLFDSLIEEVARSFADYWLYTEDRRINDGISENQWPREFRHFIEIYAEEHEWKKKGYLTERNHRLKIQFQTIHQE